MPAGDDVLTSAILDRLLQRSHVLDIERRSHRLRNHERGGQAPELRVRQAERPLGAGTWMSLDDCAAGCPRPSRHGFGRSYTMKTLMTVVGLLTLTNVAFSENTPIIGGERHTFVPCNLERVVLDWNFSDDPQDFIAVRCESGGASVWEMTEATVHAATKFQNTP